MKRPSIGATAHARIRITGRCRQLAEGVARCVVWTCKQKAPENRGSVCWGVVVRPRPVRDNHGGISSEMIVDANLDRAEFGGAGIEGESTQGIGLLSRCVNMYSALADQF